MRAIVTRPASQAGPLAEALERAGFEALVCPLIEIVPIDDGPVDVRGYDWVIVTSANGATELARRRVGELPRVAAVGLATAEVLSGLGIEPDFVPRSSSQEGLVAELPRPTGRVLLVGAADARNLIAEQLDADVRVVYRTIEVEPAEHPEGDLVLLASPSAARVWARLSVRLPAISIGPQTSAAARAAGIDVVAEARTQDVPGLVDSAVAWRSSSPS